MLSFDEKALCERLGVETGDPLISALIAVFLSDVTAISASISMAIEKKDALLAKKAFHALKGAAANVSALALSSLGSAGQQAAERGDLQTAGRLFMDLQEEVKNFKNSTGVLGGGGVP